MKTVEVKVVAVRDGETVSATIIQEKRRNDGWNRVNSWDVVSGMPDAFRRVLLNDDERLVIEGRVDTKVVYDNEQKAAVVVPVNAAKAEQLRKDDVATRETNIENEEIRRREVEAGVDNAAAAVPRTNLGNLVPPPSGTLPDPLPPPIIPRSGIVAPIPPSGQSSPPPVSPAPLLGPQPTPSKKPVR